jgi:hypothetical protein
VPEVAHQHLPRLDGVARVVTQAGLATYLEGRERHGARAGPSGWDRLGRGQLIVDGLRVGTLVPDRPVDGSGVGPLVLGHDTGEATRWLLGSFRRRIEIGRQVLDISPGRGGDVPGGLHGRFQGIQVGGLVDPQGGEGLLLRFVRALRTRSFALATDPPDAEARDAEAGDRYEPRPPKRSPALRIQSGTPGRSRPRVAAPLAPWHDSFCRAGTRPAMIESLWRAFLLGFEPQRVTQGSAGYPGSSAGLAGVA